VRIIFVCWLVLLFYCANRLLRDEHLPPLFDFLTNIWPLKYSKILEKNLLIKQITTKKSNILHKFLNKTINQTWGQKSLQFGTEGVLLAFLELKDTSSNTYSSTS
jgi:hypothetical protein